MSETSTGPTEGSASQTNNNPVPADPPAKQEGQQPTPEKTFTQAELDAVLKERLDRERKKYSDYNDLKKSAEELKALKQAQMTAEERQAAIMKELESQKTHLETELTTLRMAEVKTRAAIRVGLSSEWIPRLQGVTEEEIQADAEALSKLLGQKPPKNIGSPAPGNPKQPLGGHDAFNRAIIRAAGRGL